MRRHDGPKRAAGFTLVELLVVMVILGMLASLVLPNFFKQAEGARVKTARVQMSTLGTALDAFALDTGRYPSSQQGLMALIEQPSDMSMWDGPYIKKLPKDPWGNPYEYSGPEDGNNYEIVCLGADGRRGGDEGNADISTSD
jgi:general secretion pathway protein G